MTSIHDDLEGMAQIDGWGTLIWSRYSFPPRRATARRRVGRRRVDDFFRLAARWRAR